MTLLWQDNKSLLGLGCAVGLSVVSAAHNLLASAQMWCRVIWPCSAGHDWALKNSLNSKQVGFSSSLALHPGRPPAVVLVAALEEMD